MKHHFKAVIYKTGINWCVDTPAAIAKKLIAEKGYIRIKGQINGFDFSKSLVPVKNAPYRLFVNGIMMKGGMTALGKTAVFVIEQDTRKKEDEYPIPEFLKERLLKEQLTNAFNCLTPSRKKDILRYLLNIKTAETLEKNIDRLMKQLKDKTGDSRVP